MPPPMTTTRARAGRTTEVMADCRIYTRCTCTRPDNVLDCPPHAYFPHRGRGRARGRRLPATEEQARRHARRDEGLDGLGLGGGLRRGHRDRHRQQGHPRPQRTRPAGPGQARARSAGRISTPVYRGRMDPRAAGAHATPTPPSSRRRSLTSCQGEPGLDRRAGQAVLGGSGLARAASPYDGQGGHAVRPRVQGARAAPQEKEVGIVKTQFGYHVIERVPPPPPDPLESAGHPGAPGPSRAPVQVQHVLIGWKDAPARAAAPTARKDRDQGRRRQDRAGRPRQGRSAGGDMAAADEGVLRGPGLEGHRPRPTTSPPTPPMVEPFKKLALRLKMGEAGIVKSPFGWHVIKRVPPPPPRRRSSRPTSSSASRSTAEGEGQAHPPRLDRRSHAEDPRGKKRDRATLEKLVKDTVAKLKKGDEDRAADGGAVRGSGLGEDAARATTSRPTPAWSSRSRTCRSASRWARSAWSRPSSASTSSSASSSAHATSTARGWRQKNEMPRPPPTPPSSSRASMTIGSASTRENFST